jgi:hypothetical protein
MGDARYWKAKRKTGRRSRPGKLRFAGFTVSDTINHPKHYTSHPSGVEAITICEHMSFNIGNAMKYLFRAGKKGALTEDLEKAIWYIQREISRLGQTDSETAACLVGLAKEKK